MTDCFVLLLLVFLWCWDYPADHPAKRLVRKAGMPLVYIGLWHGWSMFAPDPIRVNRRLRAMIRFNDGSQEERCPLWARTSNRLLDMCYVRTFKYQHSVVSGESPVLCEPLCQFLARQVNSAERFAVEIDLVRQFQVVNSPDAVEPYGEQREVVFYQYRFGAKRTLQGSGVMVKPAAADSISRT